jgi:protein TonB
MPAAVGSILVHVVTVTALVVIPLLLPASLEPWRLVTLIPSMSPPPPPPGPARVAATTKTSAPEVHRTINIQPDAIVIPIEIPRAIARIIDDPLTGGVVGGVPGGIPGGIAGGVVDSVLWASDAAAPPPPPPPPPPSSPPPPAGAIVPAAPIRVGGAVKQPRLTQLVPPVYPKLALQARVEGKVLLEAIVTTEGTVEEIQVISGHPLLVQAAVDCVRQWRYEPALLNGEPVRIILPAEVNFELKHS